MLPVTTLARYGAFSTTTSLRSILSPAICAVEGHNLMLKPKSFVRDVVDVVDLSVGPECLLRVE